MISAPPWTRPHTLALAAALLLNLALLVHFHDRFWYAPDEGAYAHVAERVLDGEVLNRDVQDIHLGYVNFLHAGALALFGRSLASLRWPLMAASLGASLLVFLLFRRHGAGVAVLASLVVTAFGVLQYLDPSAHWYALALFFAVVAALAARVRPVGVGCLVGLLFGFRQLSGVLVAMGVVTWLLLEPPANEDEASRPPWLARLTLLGMAAGLSGYLATTTELSAGVLFGAWPLFVLLWAARRTRSSNGDTGRLFARLLAGGLAALAPLFLYHAFHGSLGSWYADTVLAARAQSQLPFTRQFTFVATMFSGGLTTLIQGPGLVARLNGGFWMLLPCAATGAGLTLLASLRSGRAAPLPVLAVFYALVSVHYQNPTYLFFGVSVSLLAILGWAAERGGWWKRGVDAGLVALAGIVIVFHAAQPASRTWEDLLAGRRFPVVASAALPRCGLRIDPGDLASYTAAVTLIEREVPAGEAIFALPNDPALYFLSQRKNPFRFYNFAPGVRSGDEAARVLAALRSDPPRLLFYQGQDKYNTPLSRRLIVDLVPSTYEHLTDVGPWNVFRRRSEPVAPAMRP